MRTTETCEIVSIATSDISARARTNPVPGVVEAQIVGGRGVSVGWAVTNVCSHGVT